MHSKLFGVAILALGVVASTNAQTKEKKEKEATIVIRKKTDKAEKMTIVVDGDKVTVNGKPLADMKDGEIEVIRNGEGRVNGARIRARVAPMRGMKMLMDDDHPRNHAFLGVGSEKTDNGAKILSVEKESGAEKAGLKKDDIITKVGDAKISNPDDLYEAIGKYKPEDKVNITYIRNGKENTVSATLGKSADMDNFNFNGNEFHFKMPEMPKMRNFEFNFSPKPRLGIEIQDQADGKGVKILDVDEDSPAAKNGLQKNDVITEVNGQAITSVDGIRSKLKDAKDGDTLKITFERNGKTQTAEIHFMKKLKTAEL